MWEARVQAARHLDKSPINLDKSPINIKCFIRNLGLSSALRIGQITRSDRQEALTAEHGEQVSREGTGFEKIKKTESWNQKVLHKLIACAKHMY